MTTIWPAYTVKVHLEGRTWIETFSGPHALLRAEVYAEFVGRAYCTLRRITTTQEDSPRRQTGS